MTPKPSSPIPSIPRRTLLTGGVGLVLAGCSASKEETSETPAEPSVSPSPTAAPSDGPEKIVTLLGDSITAGFGLPSAESLPVRLEEVLRAKGLRVRVRGAGVSGDTTGGGLARVGYSVQDDTDLCIVALGAMTCCRAWIPKRSDPIWRPS